MLGWIFGNARLSHLQNNVCFVLTQDGTRIDLVDDGDCSLFALGTTGMIAGSVQGMQNPIMIRGHTANVPYGEPHAVNNWMLSSGRAEATTAVVGWHARGVVRAHQPASPIAYRS